MLQGVLVSSIGRMGAEGEPPPVKFIRVHAMAFSGRVRGGGDKGGPKRNPEPCRGRRRLVIIVVGAPQPRNHATPAAPSWQPFAIRGAGGGRFIERNQRLLDRVHFNNSATIELAQRGSILDSPGIRNPRCEDCSLFRPGKFRIVRDIAGMRVDRRPVTLRWRSRLLRLEKFKALVHLRSPQSGLPVVTGRRTAVWGAQIRRPSWRSGRSASADCPASLPSSRCRC